MLLQNILVGNHLENHLEVRVSVSGVVLMQVKWPNNEASREFCLFVFGQKNLSKTFFASRFTLLQNIIINVHVVSESISFVFCAI